MAISILTTFGLLFAAAVGAQDGAIDDERARAEASIEYNAATRVQREGYEHEAGGPDTPYLDRCLMDCVHHALLSFQAMPGLLSSWRMASCASGRGRHVTAWLAFAAFDQIEPAGIAAYESNHITTADRLRVLAGYARRNDLVGGVRLPSEYQVQWADATAANVAAGQLYDSDDQLVLVDGVYYGLVGTTHSVVVQGEDETRRIEVSFVPLSSGIQDVVVFEPEPELVDVPQVAAPTVEEPVLEQPGPTEQVLTDPPPQEEGGGAGLAVSGWVSLAAGVIGVATGAILWSRADSIQQDLDTACPTRMGCSPMLVSDHDRGRNLTLGGNIAVIGGSVLAALGLVLLITDFASASSTDLSVRASTTSVELQIGGRL